MKDIFLEYLFVLFAYYKVSCGILLLMIHANWRADEWIFSLYQITNHRGISLRRFASW
ncbi:hypothetical protein GCM10007968_17980 [Sporolactobacillus putidus]|uniref:Uncharacterized protein n=1 Tax=Sporolactobacillus putidus TaxID=492735 RepID=A0A917S326_9BACL|nr:hypothetical protein GCM10007968_17980 [Sporolactobacillus putidus]